MIRRQQHVDRVGDRAHDADVAKAYATHVTRRVVRNFTRIPQAPVTLQFSYVMFAIASSSEVHRTPTRGLICRRPLHAVGHGSFTRTLPPVFMQMLSSPLTTTELHQRSIASNVDAVSVADRGVRHGDPVTMMFLHGRQKAGSPPRCCGASPRSDVFYALHVKRRPGVPCPGASTTARRCRQRRHRRTRQHRAGVWLD